MAAALSRPRQALLEGSKAPDTEFKDFKNHVLHTRDGYWGGAPEKVRSWYHHLVEALAQQDWQTAVHCAGVLSHYYTDPLQPLHTAQSEAENNVHRAIEWSISKAYDSLARQGETEFASMSVELPPGPNWLAQLVCQGAEEGQSLLREADRSLRYPARRRRSAGGPRPRLAEADKLCADVLAFAASKDGQRMLRNGDPPDIEKIKGWLEAALSVKAA